MLNFMKKKRPKKNKGDDQTHSHPPLTVEEMRRLNEVRKQMGGSSPSSEELLGSEASLPTLDEHSKNSLRINKRLSSTNQGVKENAWMNGRTTSPRSSRLSSSLSQVSRFDVSFTNANEALPSAKEFGVELTLPPLLQVKHLPARQILLKRNSQGDFGFSLRKGSTIERTAEGQQKKSIMFAEPGTGDRLYSSGLLPGDRLIEVNSHNVEHAAQDDIVGKIRAAGDQVVLKVEPILELSELSTRIEIGGGQFSAMKKVALGGRRSSRSFSETDSSLVWLMHSGGITLARKLPEMTASGKLMVQLDSTEETIEVNEDFIENANPSHLSRCEDLSQLKYLNESSLLHVLRQRYLSNLIHTYAGRSLVVVNPMHKLSIYSEKVMQMFRGCKMSEMPPHIYAVAQNAYRSMQQSRKNQCIVTLGHSGSGKTTNARHLIHYLVTISGSKNINSEKLNAAWLLLEVFGNSRTVGNINASRYAQLSRLNFDHTGQLMSMNIQVSLFESKRVVVRPDGEPTFHIFYEMMAGLSDEASEQLHLNNLGESNSFFTPLKNTEDREKAKQSWSRFRRGLFVLGVTEAEVSALCSIMASVILFGYTQMDPRGQWSDFSIAEKAANLLGIGLQDLSSTFIEPPVKGVASEVTPQQRLEVFVCGLYDELFKMVLALINRALASNHRSTCSIIIADCPGLQGGSGHMKHSSTWSELQYNYLYERLLLLYFESNFQNPIDLYTQEGVSFDLEPLIQNPRMIVDLLDKQDDPKGILWLASQVHKTGELALRVRSNQEAAMKAGVLALTDSHLQLRHCFAASPVTYRWDKSGILSHDHVNSRMPKQFLLDSSKPDIQNLCTLSGSMSSALSRSHSIRLTGMRPSLKLKVSVDSLVETIRACKLHFVHCLLPRTDAGLSALKNLSTGESFIMPFVRTQVQGLQLVDLIRFHKQGYPDQIPYLEFLRRFEVLATGQLMSHNEQRATESFLMQIQIQKVSYQLGFTQLFLRAGIQDNLESLRDEKVSAMVVQFQALCRSVLARRKVEMLRVRHLAIRCLQRNIRQWFLTKDWPWWKLYTKVQPLVNVHRTEEDLKDASDELTALKNKLERVSSERDSLKVMCDKLEVRLGEVSSQLADEQMTTRNMQEVIEQEEEHRRSLELKYQEIHDSNLSLSKSKKDLESQLRSASFYTEDDIEDVSAKRVPLSELESLRSHLQSDYEAKMSDELTTRKSVERKMRDMEADRDELEKQIIQMRRKIAKLSQENADVTLHAQDIETRNADLEKQQRGFDADLAAARDEANEERILKERFQRERNEMESNKFALQKEMDETSSELDSQKEKVSFLDRQIKEILSEGADGLQSSHESLSLKRSIHDLQQKITDLEQEVDDQAGDIQMLQQTKLKLEMDKQNLIQRYTKEIEDKDNDIEEIRVASQRKGKQLQVQADEEFAERQRIQKEKHDLELRIQQLETASPMINEPSSVGRYKKEVKRLKMLYRDAQRQLERADEQVFKQQLKQLRNQLEDSELNATSYLKSKKALESDVHELTQQLDETKAAKQEVEEKMLALMRDRNNLTSQLDEQKEDMEEVMRKFRNAIQQQAVDKAMQQDLLQQIQKLNSDNQTLREELSEATTRISFFEDNFVERQQLQSAELKYRETESKLEFTQTSKLRSESGLSRLKEQLTVETRERESLQSQHQKLQDNVKKLQRQVREKQQECIELQRREDDEAAKRMDMERQMYLLQQDYVRSQSDLKLALRRIDDLQTQLEAEFESDDDSYTINFSGSESENEDVEAILSRYRNRSATDSSMGSSARSAPEHLVATRTVSDSPRSDGNEANTVIPAVTLSESVV